MNRPAAIYARVSSDRQKEQHTIASQTAALREYAQTHGYSVPAEWVFQDEGYSGALLVRPGLEALRDLAATGQIEAALVYAPDRLSRKYAYQVLLAEELQRCGVALVFLQAPTGATPEDQLLVQFQGMIAEYERAQIAERCRRGKRHRAHQGAVNVLSGAPYGYRYVRRTETSVAAYEVLAAEANVVRQVFTRYTERGESINAIARWLNATAIPTRSGTARWERSTVWGLLRNPAYAGHACYGKTALRPRQRITRPLRQRGASPSRCSANRERPRQDWIAIPVPALVSETTFARAQELLQQNKRFAPRRTLEPTLLQGMLVCRQCGYARYRTSTRTSQRTLYYYRCLGSDRYRHLKGPVCTNRPVRQDALDQLVWTEVLRLLDDPALIEAEIARRRAVARTTDPLRVRTDELQREQARLDKSSERLLSAYQEGLMSLAQLRQRMPELQQRARAVAAEIHALELAAVDEARYLQLAETLAGFRATLRARAETLDVRERQQVLRLIVKEVLVDRDTITLRHSIPIPPADAGANGLPPTSAGPPAADPNPDYLLRSGRQHAPLRGPVTRPLAAPRLPLPVIPFDHHRRAQPGGQPPQDVSVCDPPRHRGQQAIVRDRVEVGRQVGVKHLRVALRERAGDVRHGLVGVPLRAEAIRTRLEVRFEDGFEYQDRGGLDHAVPDGRDTERPLAPTPLGDHHTPDGVGPVGVGPELLGQMREERGDPARLHGRDGHPVDARGAAVRAHQGPGVTQDIRPVDLVVEEVEPEGRLRLGLAVERPLEGPHCLWRFEPHGNPPGGSPSDAW
jgi:site-specific DNA recombinase